MVHAFKPTRKLGFGLLSPRGTARLTAAVEAGYLLGSLLFMIGTVFFFPAEFLEDFRLGCRFFEIGSLMFFFLTFYTEVDGYLARRRDDEQRIVTKRELLEQLSYCSGSFVFLVGTFLFDPPAEHAIARTLHIPASKVENTGAVLFMIGSFMFSLGSYINALSIFEAPRMFRRHLITVTTCYQFGGLMFVAGTMGYVDAFEPNVTMKWCATWMYMVGCLFYVTGTGLAFVRTVASHQVRWERKQARRDAKRCERVMSKPNLIGNSIASSPHNHNPTIIVEDDLCKIVDSVAADASGAAEQLEFEDVEKAQHRLAGQLEAVLGADAGFALAAALQDQEEGLLEEDLFGAFWRSVWNTSDTDAGGCKTTDGPGHRLQGTATATRAVGSTQSLAANANPGNLSTEAYSDNEAFL